MSQDTAVQAFDVRIPRNLHLQARLKSIRVDKSLNQVITEAIEAWVTQPDEKTQDPKPQAK